MLMLGATTNKDVIEYIITIMACFMGFERVYI